MPTQADRDRGDEVDKTGDVDSGAKLRSFRLSSLLLPIVTIIIVVCVVFAILSTQTWFVELLRNLAK